MSIALTYAPHPLLAPGAFVSNFPVALGELAPSEGFARWLRADADAPFRPDEAIRGAVRDLLRWGGYKPTGRGKPASEYLVRAAAEGALNPINAAVDACNAASLHSGLPVSVVDLDRARPPFHLAVAPLGSSYVFNASGQLIDLGGLVCLFDAEGPCANAVKDAQRTKTQASTRRTLSIVWGAKPVEARLAPALAWYRHLVTLLGAEVEDVELRPSAEAPA
jgi:DNA/RNA-binding domain of Phe-tRNA-synthetase-like protein